MGTCFMPPLAPAALDNQGKTTSPWDFNSRMYPPGYSYIFLKLKAVWVAICFLLGNNFVRLKAMRQNRKMSLFNYNI